MSTPVDSNRLREDDGPYLGTLADDPVQWQPWDERSFMAAETADVPIFLSVGNQLSPWCHRMHEESFRDRTVATRLNEAFVPVAVDRERRPDIDEVYQTVARIVDGSGGWPLSAWLTPDGRPFYIGTYFPPTHTDYAPGFPELTELIAEKWGDSSVRGVLDERATEWTAYAHEELDVPPDPPHDPPVGQDALSQSAGVVVRAVDPEHGGWGTETKYPDPTRLRLLLSAASRGNDDRYRTVMTQTLNAMVQGPIRDHIGGGFFAHAQSPDWSDPVVEKSLELNAEIARVLIASYQLLGRSRYATAAMDTFDFIERELRTESGGYAVGLAPHADAETSWNEAPSSGYYRWSPSEAEVAVDDRTNEQLIRARYGLGDTDAEIPRITRTIDAIAEDAGLPPSDVRARLEDARERLRKARESRPPRVRDDRVCAGVNGLAIQALAHGSIALDEPTLAHRADEICEGLTETLWDGEALVARYTDASGGHPEEDPFLDDYAYLGCGILACYEATGDLDRLRFATQLGRSIIQRFWDGDRLTLVAAGANSHLLVNPQVTRDRVAPAAIPAAVDLLSNIAHIVDDEECERVAQRIVETYRPRVITDLLAHHTLALTIHRLQDGPTKLIMQADTLPDPWKRWLARRYLPHRLIARHLREDLAGLDGELPPAQPSRAAPDQEPNRSLAVYIERGAETSGPLTKPDEADEWLSRSRAS